MENVNVLVVFYGMVINMIIFFFDKLLINLDLVNVSVIRFVFENGKWIIEIVNDLSYIEVGKLVLV